MNLHTDGYRDGTSFEPKRDTIRLNRQAQLVWDIIKDAQWRTLRQISEASGAPEASVSARLRDFRKPRFGGHIILRAHHKHGQFKYCLMLPVGQLKLL